MVGLLHRVLAKWRSTAHEVELRMRRRFAPPLQGVAIGEGRSLVLKGDGAQLREGCAAALLTANSRIGYRARILILGMVRHDT